MESKYSKSTIESLIKKLDSKVNERVEVIAIGGTAMSLTGGKEYSKDIDLCYLRCTSPLDFAQSAINAGVELGIKPGDIELFQGFEMSFLDIPNFDERAIPYKKLQLKNITLKTMHPADIILSKIYRGELRDKEDIKRILDLGQISVEELKSRFIEISKNQKDMEVRREFMRKYENFIKAWSEENG